MTIETYTQHIIMHGCKLVHLVSGLCVPFMSLAVAYCMFKSVAHQGECFWIPSVSYLSTMKRGPFKLDNAANPKTLHTNTLYTKMSTACQIQEVWQKKALSSYRCNCWEEKTTLLPSDGLAPMQDSICVNQNCSHSYQGLQDWKSSSEGKLG